MIRPRPEPVPPTPLQLLQGAVFDVLVDARDLLEPRSFAVFISYCCDLIAREAARCARWEDRHGEDEAA